MYRRTPPPHHGGTIPTPPDAKRLQTAVWEALFASKSFEIDIVWIAFQIQMVMMILLPHMYLSIPPTRRQAFAESSSLTAINNVKRSEI